MEAKLIVVLALVAVVHSAVIPESEFSYEVANAETGDYKNQLEARVNGAVYGHYALREPDGSKRIVSYIADKDGFNAVVRNLAANARSGSTDKMAATLTIAQAAAEPRAPIVEPSAVGVRTPMVEKSAVESHTPAVVPGVVDARFYPAFYFAGPSVIPTWPYGPLLK